MDYIPPQGAPADASYENHNVPVGNEGSVPLAAAFEHPQREILHVIKQGLGENAPDSADLEQLYKAILQLIQTNSAPTLNEAGKVAHFAMTTPPTGWLKADGSAVSRATYADLYTAIGDTWGNGNGTTTFNLPDLRGEFIRSFDDGRGVDAGRSFDANYQKGTLNGGDYDGVSGSHRTANISTTNGFSGRQEIGLDDIPNHTDYDGTVLVWSSPDYSSFHISSEAQRPSFGVSRPRNIALLACIKY